MNSFFGIGFMELAFIAILALIVLGPERLPAAAREVAKFYQQLRTLSSELTSQFSEELKLIDELNPQKLMNDLAQDVTNPPKKAPQKKAATTPPAAKKATSPAQPANGGDPAAEAPEEENRILPPTAAADPSDTEGAGPDGVAQEVAPDAEGVESQAEKQTGEDA